MLDIQVETLNLEKIDKQIKCVKSLLTIKKNSKFQQFIQSKCMSALNETMSERLYGTTNYESIELYKNNNKIITSKDGFIIYNDTTIDAIVSGDKKSNYEDGKFKLALAFEYGVGIVGETTNSPNSWEYNINNYEDGWYYPNCNHVKTLGYQGMEIYRYTRIKIEQNLIPWAEEYLGGLINND